MTTTDFATRYVDALSTAYDVMLDTVRASANTNVQLSQRLLDEAQQAQQRTLGLVRRVAENPADFTGNINAFIEASAEAQSQALAFTRSLAEAAPRAREQARGRFDRLAQANREVVRAAVEASRELAAANPWTQAFRPAAQA